MKSDRINPPDEDAIEDAILQFLPDTNAVPPPVQNEIDALVDAVSVGGRPMLSSEPDAIAEADDSAFAEFSVVPSALQPSRVSAFHPAAFRFVAGALVAFALGVLIAWGMLRSVDVTPPSMASHQPTVVDPARAPAAAPIAPERVAPTPPPSKPETAVAATPRAPVVTPAAPPAATPRERAVAPTSRPNATGVTQPRTMTRAATPNVTAEAIPKIPNTPPVTVAPQPEAAPRDVAEIAAVSPPTAPTVAPVVAPPAVAAPLAPAAAVVAAVALEQNAVLQTLREYTQAYDAMDVGATAAVWPSVDRRALARAFATLKSQELELLQCEVAIADNSATTRCRGTVEYVRKFGSPTPRTGSQEWVFKMRKLGGDWFIDGVDVSQRSTLSEVARRGAS